VLKEGAGAMREPIMVDFNNDWWVPFSYLAVWLWGLASGRFR
jgi:hypothetical protein